MNVIYIGCKPVMNAKRMSFPRGEPIEVTETLGTELLKIDGFVSKLTPDAKKELKRNGDREKEEKEKLAGQVKVVKVKDEELEAELEIVKQQLEEAINGSQLESLMKENAALKAELDKLKQAAAKGNGNK